MSAFMIRRDVLSLLICQTLGASLFEPETHHTDLEEHAMMIKTQESNRTKTLQRTFVLLLHERLLSCVFGPNGKWEDLGLQQQEH